MDRKELQRLVRKYLIENGRGAKGMLAGNAGVSTRLIDEIERHAHMPKPANVYSLLKAMNHPIPEELYAVS